MSAASWPAARHSRWARTVRVAFGGARCRPSGGPDRPGPRRRDGARALARHPDDPATRAPADQAWRLIARTRYAQSPCRLARRSSCSSSERALSPGRSRRSPPRQRSAATRSSIAMSVTCCVTMSRSACARGTKCTRAPTASGATATSGHPATGRSRWSSVTRSRSATRCSTRSHGPRCSRKRSTRRS